MTVFLFCSSPQNPYTNPDNAIIRADSSLVSLNDTLKISTEYKCSVNVYLPNLVDSFFVRVSDSTIQKGAVNGISPISFSYTPADTGAYQVRFVIVKTNGSKDSLVKTGHVISPASPDSARIQGAGSLNSLKDTLKNSTAYKCSVNVYLPNFIDSFFVRSGDSTILTGAVNGTSPIVFSFTPADTGAYQVRFVIVKTNGGKDSLVKTGYVAALPSLAPRIVPVVESIHLILGDSAVVTFILTDPDSNLAGYTTQLNLDQDTALSHAINHTYSILSRVGHDTITRKLKETILFQGIKDPLICYAQAIDRQSNYSNVAACTVYVADTIPPSIARLRPAAGKDSIFILPDTIIARIKDNWGVDSVKLNGNKMALSRDSAVSIVPSLALGESFDTITAWDSAGNKTSLVFPRIYSGPKVYPPEVKNLSRAVFTGHRFDTLLLDTCALPTDPSFKDTVNYQKSLIWQIVDSAGTSLSIPGSRKFVVPAPSDTLWNGTVKLTFVAIASTGPSAPAAALFTVRDRPGTPVITLGNQSKQLGNSFDTLFLDTCVKDANDSLNTLNWTFKNGNYFKVDSIIECPPCIRLPCLKCIKPTFRRRIAINPDTTKIKPATWKGNDTLYFTVKDPEGLSKTKPIVFTKWSFIIKPPPIIGPILPKKKSE